MLCKRRGHWQFLGVWALKVLPLDTSLSDDAENGFFGKMRSRRWTFKKNHQKILFFRGENWF